MRDTHDEWCSENAEEPYVTWMEDADRIDGEAQKRNEFRQRVCLRNRESRHQKAVPVVRRRAFPKLSKPQNRDGDGSKLALDTDSTERHKLALACCSDLRTLDQAITPMISRIECSLSVEAIGKGWLHVYACGRDCDDRQKTVGLLISRDDLREFIHEAEREMNKPDSHS